MAFTATVGTLAIWLWSWAVARGIMRTTCSSVVFSPTLPPQYHHKCQHTPFLQHSLKLYLPTPHPYYLPPRKKLPFYLRRISWVLVAAPIAMLCHSSRWLGWEISGRLDEQKGTVVWRQMGIIGGFRERRKGSVTNPAFTLMTISLLTLTFSFTFTAYPFVAHTLAAPNLGLGAAVIAATFTALVELFRVALVKDTADTLYLCYCIDKEMGKERRGIHRFRI